MTASLIKVTDNLNVSSPLRLSTTHASSYGSGDIATNVQFGASSLSTNTTGNGNTAIGNSAYDWLVQAQETRA